MDNATGSARQGTVRRPCRRPGTSRRRRPARPRRPRLMRSPRSSTVTRTAEPRARSTADAGVTGFGEPSCLRCAGVVRTDHRGDPVIRYLLRRSAGWLVMLVVATNLTFLLATWYLDPRSNYVGRRPPVPESVINSTLSSYNLNDQDPLLERWWTWAQGVVLHWDWGTSPIGESVNEQVSFRIWVS